MSRLFFFPSFLLVGLGLLVGAPSASAQEAAAEASRATEGWTISAGGFDLADNTIAEGGLEYRFPAFRIKNVPIAVAAGISGNADGGSWIYGTFRYNYPLGKGWIISPQVGASLYEDGDGKDLGGPLEFRSGLELSVDVGPGRLGFVFYHLSNGGVYVDNPGENSLVLQWTFGD